VAVRAPGHILAFSKLGATVHLVGPRRLLVTGATALASDLEWLPGLAVRNRVAILVAIEAFQALMDRVRNVVRHDGTLGAGLMTVGAGRAVDGLVLFVPCAKGSGDEQAHHEGNSGHQKTPVSDPRADGSKRCGHDTPPPNIVSIFREVSTEKLFCFL
jgi:hypothetical protein